MKLVEAVQASLKAMEASEDFSYHILYAQCAMLDDVVLNTASNGDNYVWLRNPLQVLFMAQMRAGEVMPERIQKLLREPVPDPRLLVLYQRLLGMEYGRLWQDKYEEHVRRESTLQWLGSLNALVPVGDQPLSAPLVVERRPTVTISMVTGCFCHQKNGFHRAVRRGRTGKRSIGSPLFRAGGYG